jgi:hypothetical protein
MNLRSLASLVIAMLANLAFLTSYVSAEEVALGQTVLKQSDSAQRAQTQLSISSGLQNWKEGADNGLTTSLGVNGNLKYKILNSVFANASVDAKTTAGRVQDYAGKSEGSKFSIREASLKFEPLVNALSFSVGAINQESLKAPLLVSDRAFIGLKQDGVIATQLGQIQLQAQQLVPTSETLNSDRNVEEPMPFFFSQTVGLRSPQEQSLSAGLMFSLFQFQELPSVVSSESSLLGNTVYGGAGPSSRFAETFEGYHLGIDAQMRLIDFASIKLWGNWLQNQAAVSESSHGQLVGASLQLVFPEFSIEPKLEVFFKESDAVPASYSSATYGHNNRQGYRASVDLGFPSAGMLASVSYVRADPILISPVQDQLENIEIRIQFNDIKF